MMTRIIGRPAAVALLCLLVLSLQFFFPECCPLDAKRLRVEGIDGQICFLLPLVVAQGNNGRAANSKEDNEHADDVQPGGHAHANRPFAKIFIPSH
ncbi:hypothetical protein, partial [Cardiobacterium valvarum]